jgi:flavodoxin
MKSVVIYDSLYGNTAQVALAIAGVLGTRGEVSLLKAGEATLDHLIGAELLVVGSPTQKFKPTAGLVKFLNTIPKNGLMGINVAAFDTRFTQEEINKTPPLPFFVRLFGFASGRIAKSLRAKGGELVALPEGFFVRGMEGPLLEGELERAAGWAGKLFA